MGIIVHFSTGGGGFSPFQSVWMSLGSIQPFIEWILGTSWGRVVMV
jgi:hypothetical protein